MILLAGATYAGVCMALRVEEARDAAKMVLGKILRRFRRGG
jgi:hypothetical protein